MFSAARHEVHGEEDVARQNRCDSLSGVCSNGTGLSLIKNKKGNVNVLHITLHTVRVVILETSIISEKIAILIKL